MAVQQIPVVRNNKTYVEHIGTDNGQSVHFIVEADINPLTGNPDRWRPIRTTIERTPTGGVAWISTKWGRHPVGADGSLMLLNETFDTMHTNQVDIGFFVMGLGLPIMKSESNGWVRKIKGFNNFPIWNSANLQLIAYSPEQEAEAPTNDYDTPTPA